MTAASKIDWYWIDGTAYCPACVECESPAADAADCARGPASGRCACCHQAAEGEIDRVHVYQAADGCWYYAAWIGREHDHTGEIADAETETEAVAEMRAAWPAATVSVRCW